MDTGLAEVPVCYLLSDYLDPGNWHYWRRQAEVDLKAATCWSTEYSSLHVDRFEITLTSFNWNKHCPRLYPNPRHAATSKYPAILSHKCMHVQCHVANLSSHDPLSLSGYPIITL